jgi:hypothetical protein
LVKEGERMPKFRRIPVIVEAVKITRPITIDTLEGSITGNPGDYLITEASGEQYPLAAEVFTNEFEPYKARMSAKSAVMKSMRKVKRKTMDFIKKNGPE